MKYNIAIVSLLVTLSCASATLAETLPFGYAATHAYRMMSKRAPRRIPLSMDLTRSSINVQPLHSGVVHPERPDIIPFTGKGIAIGIIDGGIDPRHPAFSTPNTVGSSRISMYLVTTSAAESETGMLQSHCFDPSCGYNVPAENIDRSNGGHGTHTAGIAAGSDLSNPYYGIAPEATLLLTSMGESLYDDEIMLGIYSTMKKAEELGMPCVASLSLGTPAAPHDGSSPVSMLCGELADKGRLICFAAGNDGTNPVSLSQNFRSSQEPLSTALFDTSTRCGVRQAYVDFHSEYGEPYEVAFSLVRLDPGYKEVWRSEFFSAVDVRTASGGLMDVLAVYPELQKWYSSSSVLRLSNTDNNYGMAMEVDVHKPDGVRDDYTLGIIVKSDSGAEIEMHTDYSLAGFGSFGINGYTRGSGDQSVSAYCVSPHVVSVGAYNARERYIDIFGNEHLISDTSFGEYGTVATYSSYGVYGGNVYPVVVAPGTDVISSIYPGTEVPVAVMTDTDGNDWIWGAMSGTSMATPAVAGVIALWLQAEPSMTTEDVMEVIRNTSKDVPQASDGVCRTRYGMVDAYAGLKYILDKQSSLHSVENKWGGEAFDRPSGLMTRYFADGEVEAVVPFDVNGGTYRLYSSDGRLCADGLFEGVSFRCRIPKAGVWLLSVHTPAGVACQKLVR